jgi:hypothetical protein
VSFAPASVAPAAGFPWRSASVPVHLVDTTQPKSEIVILAYQKARD